MNVLSERPPSRCEALRSAAGQGHGRAHSVVCLGADHPRDLPNRLNPCRIEVADHIVESEHAATLDEPLLLVHAPILAARAFTRVTIEIVRRENHHPDPSER